MQAHAKMQTLELAGALLEEQLTVDVGKGMVGASR